MINFVILGKTIEDQGWKGVEFSVVRYEASLKIGCQINGYT